MAYYLTEIKHNNTIYTLADSYARSLLKNKADLVNNIVPKNQLPTTLIYNDTFTQTVNQLNERITVLDNKLAGKVDSITVAGFVTEQEVQTLIDSAHDGLVTTADLTERLKNYLNKTTVDTHISEVLPDMVGDAFAQELTKYLTITAAAETYAKISSLAKVATTGAYSDLSGKPTIPSTATDVGALPYTSSNTTATTNIIKGLGFITSVNGQTTTTGAVSLTASHVNALASDTDISNIADANDLLKAYTGGTNIEVTTDRVINCTLTAPTYTEGDGINIGTDNKISADFTEVARATDIVKYKAGTGISFVLDETDGAYSINCTVNPGSGGTSYIEGDGISLTASAEGTTISVDFTEVAKASDVIKYTAGSGIAFEPNADGSYSIRCTITVGDGGETVYTGGTGIDVNGTEISVDFTEVAKASDVVKYTAGTNISFTQNTDGSYSINCTSSSGGGVTEESDPIWIKERDAYATKEYVMALIQNTNTTLVTRKGPTTITKPESNSVALDISLYTYATVSAFSINTDEGELFVPLFSDQGISKILKNTQNTTNSDGSTTTSTLLTLTLSDTLLAMTWTDGYVYLNQFLDTGNSADTYWVDDSGNLFIVDANADSNPHLDSTTGTLSIVADNYTTVSVSSDGILEITTNS